VLRTLAMALLLAGPAFGESSLELAGTWHVLVHYKDDNTLNPERERWDDRIWRFERVGNRLRWREYPIVVFSDESGRFERRGSGQYARILGSWEPSEGQRAQIVAGLEVNPRGMKSKTLRGSDAEGWRSHSRRAPASASVISYVEHWSIDGVMERPVFTREDQLGAERAEDLVGVTRYTTRSIDPGGDVLRGVFERDGTRHGTFRMTRSGEATDVKGSGKTPGQRAVDIPGLGEPG
jgi:hypothetical protein